MSKQKKIKLQYIDKEALSISMGVLSTMQAIKHPKWLMQNKNGSKKAAKRHQKEKKR